MPRACASRPPSQAAPVSVSVCSASAGVVPGAGASRMKALRAVWRVHQRLMQVPAAGHDVGEGRAAHEAGVVARAAQRLAHPVAEQHHVVGGRHRIGGVEHRFDLARAQFDLQRLQRQAQRLRRVLHDAQRLLGHVDPALGQQVVAGVDHADRRRQAGPGGQLRVQVRAVLRVLDAVDVELDLQPADHAEAPLRPACPAPAAGCAACPAAPACRPGTTAGSAASPCPAPRAAA